MAAHPDLAERAETVLGQVLERTTLGRASCDVAILPPTTEHALIPGNGA
ncbi:MAG: hypothetical protein ACUVS5_05475 [Anaerolineae bacterium]